MKQYAFQKDTESTEEEYAPCGAVAFPEEGGKLIFVHRTDSLCCAKAVYPLGKVRCDFSGKCASTLYSA